MYSTALDFLEDYAGETAIDELYDDEGPADDTDSRGDNGDYGDLIDDTSFGTSSAVTKQMLRPQGSDGPTGDVASRKGISSSALPIKRVLMVQTEGPQLMLEEEEED